MADVIKAAKDLMLSTPFGDSRLFITRQDHYLFLLKLEAGKL